MSIVAAGTAMSSLAAVCRKSCIISAVLEVDMPTLLLLSHGTHKASAVKRLCVCVCVYSAISLASNLPQHACLPVVLPSKRLLTSDGRFGGKIVEKGDGAKSRIVGDKSPLAGSTGGAPVEVERQSPQKQNQYNQFESIK